MRKTRENGILLPVFSLPSKYGIGTLGEEAYRFVDFLASSKVDIWQMLPLNVTSYGDSPYQSPSSTGLNYFFIDLETLVKEKLLTVNDIDCVDFGSDPRKIDYTKIFYHRLPVLKKAFAHFNHEKADFIAFEKKGKYRDFAFFMTMKELHHYKPWYEWDEGKKYTSLIEKKVLSEHRETYLFYVWTQYEFLKQYKALKEYANQKDIRIMGDMPLYLARDSVEAYKYPQMFCFDEDLNPTVVAGCPPDYFNEDGQLWGNPIYDWKYMKSTGYDWWNKRIENNLELFDILRIDHFRGIAGYYTIPYGNKNARIGEWVKGPGKELFVNKQNLPIIAEDLGYIDEDVRTLLKYSGYPGMKILEFAFDGSPENEHKPFNTMYNYVTYTGTHDNETLLGYLTHLKKSDREKFERDLKKQCAMFAVDYKDETDEDVVRSIDALCYASPAKLAILPYADAVIFGDEARLNEPAILNGSNWTFRYLKEDFNDEVSNFLKSMIEKYR